MGMFDYIKCEVQLPGYSYITDEKFQTKSFECLLENYVISDNRQIYRELWDYEWIDNTDSLFGKQLVKVDGTYRRDYLTDLHGDIIFYTERPPADGKWYDYFARFTEGKLTRIWMKESGIW
jgi:hypothetical protein